LAAFRVTAERDVRFASDATRRRAPSKFETLPDRHTDFVFSLSAELSSWVLAIFHASGTYDVENVLSIMVDRFYALDGKGNELKAP
jgi:hypothetical protein